MNNPFSNMNRKQRRAFDKLSSEDKKKVASVAINNAVSSAFSGKAAEFMITGMDLERERIYKIHVSRIDEEGISEEERKERIESLLSFLRKSHIKYVSEHGNEHKKRGGRAEDVND